MIALKGNMRHGNVDIFSMVDGSENSNIGLFRLVMDMVKMTDLLVIIKVDWMVVMYDQSKRIINEGLVDDIVVGIDYG